MNRVRPFDIDWFASSAAQEESLLEKQCKRINLVHVVHRAGGT